MVLDRPFRRLPLLVAALVALQSGGATAQTTRARGDYDKVVPVAPRNAPQPDAAPQAVQREPSPRRPAAAPAQGQAAPRPDADPAAPPVIIWQPSQPTPARPPAARPTPRVAPPGQAVPARPEADASVAPRAVAEAFLRSYLQVRPVAGLPNATQHLRLRVHLSPALDAAFAAAGRAAREYRQQGGGTLQEGDVFTSRAEGAGSASVGECAPDGQRFACVARLSAGQGAEWQDRILLARSQAGWKVDDIAYGGRFANGNFGTLKELLTILVRQVAPRPAPPNAGQPPQPPAQ